MVQTIFTKPKLERTSIKIISFGSKTSIVDADIFGIKPCYIICGCSGIGFGTLIIDLMVNVYYIVILAWAVYFFLASLTSVLPWSHCNNPWNTPRCSLDSSMKESCRENNMMNHTTAQFSFNNSDQIQNCSFSNLSTVDPTVEFWEKKVLQISDGIGESGGVIWELALCLLFVWIVVYFCIWRGVKWTGKVVYFTATFPYVMILILLIRGLTLEGAWIGILYYLKPDFNRLQDPQVWVEGGTQVFYSYAIVMGAMIALGSYNKFHHNFYKDVLIISCINSGTSILGGFVVFSILGFMSVKQNVDISVVAESGPGLVFIAYPKAVTFMPLPPLWSCLFFLMLFLVGLDSEFVAVEALITHVIDLFPKQLYNKRGRMLFTLAYCVLSFLVGLSMVTKGGMYVFQLFDYYSFTGVVALCLCFCEAFVVAWVYGCDKFYDDIQYMIGYRIHTWFKICWKFVTPAITMAIFLFQAIKFTPLTFNKTYQYPSWAQSIGICMSAMPILCVPAVFVYQLGRSQGTPIQRLKQAKQPIYGDYHPYERKEINSTENFR